MQKPRARFLDVTGAYSGGLSMQHAGRGRRKGANPFGVHALGGQTLAFTTDESRLFIVDI